MNAASSHVHQSERFYCDARLWNQLLEITWQRSWYSLDVRRHQTKI